MVVINLLLPNPSGITTMNLALTSLTSLKYSLSFCSIYQLWSSRASSIIIPEERKLETSVLYGFSVAAHRWTSGIIGQNSCRWATHLFGRTLLFLKHLLVRINVFVCKSVGYLKGHKRSLEASRVLEEYAKVKNCREHKSLVMSDWYTITQG